MVSGFVQLSSRHILDVNRQHIGQRFVVFNVEVLKLDYLGTIYSLNRGCDSSLPTDSCRMTMSTNELRVPT